MTMLKLGNIVADSSRVSHYDFSGIEQLIVSVQLVDGSTHQVINTEAIELAMLIKPSVLEGKRLKWATRAWMVHNLVGHPLMQLLSLFGMHQHAISVHERTIPRPIGKK